MFGRVLNTPLFRPLSVFCKLKAEFELSRCYLNILLDEFLNLEDVYIGQYLSREQGSGSEKA